MVRIKVTGQGHWVRTSLAYLIAGKYFRKIRLSTPTREDYTLVASGLPKEGDKPQLFIQLKRIVEQIKVLCRSPQIRLGRKSSA
jgi:hypothetical protein